MAKFLPAFIRGVPRYSQLVAAAVALNSEFLNLNPENVQFKLMIESHQTVCLRSTLKC